MKQSQSTVIFSLYVDIPEKDLDEQPPHHDSKLPKTLHTKLEFQKHADWLIGMQRAYAQKIGSDYKLFEYDEKYQKFAETMPEEITAYNVVNFYKLHLLYELSKEYDKVLYLDLDVIPVTDENYFERWSGLSIMSGTAESQKSIQVHPAALKRQSDKTHSNRSPIAKYWNTHALLNEGDYDTSECTVFNTGIVGADKETLDKLGYFDSFEEDLKLMKYIQEDWGLYPEWIRRLFGYDNETLWGYKMISKEIPYNKLDPQWHHFMDKWSFIPNGTKLIHCIKKDFDYVKNWCEKNNLLPLQ